MSKYSAEMERLFRSQFRQEQGRLVFRRNGRGPPVPVTENEMEDSVALFLRRERQLRIPLFAVPIALIFILVALDGGRLFERDGAIWLLVAVLGVSIAVAIRWQWRSSTDMFSGRTPLSSKLRARAELRAEMLRRWSWPKLLGFLGLGLLLTVPRLFEWPPKSIDNWMWLLLGLVLLAVSLFNVSIKLRLGSNSGGEI